MEQHRPNRGCQWPMWAHGDRPNHDYCGDHREAGSSYCSKHRHMSIRDFAEEPRQPFIPARKAA